MASALYGNTVTITMTFDTEDSGVPVDPTEATLTIYDGARRILETAELADFTKTDTGVYSYNYATPLPSAVIGSLLARVVATVEGVQRVGAIKIDLEWVSD